MDFTRFSLTTLLVAVISPLAFGQQCTYITTLGTKVTDSVLQPGITSLSGCLTLCTDTPTCLAASITVSDAPTFECLFSSVQDGATEADTNFEIYVPSGPNCNREIPSTTAAPATVATAAPGSCTGTFADFADANIDDGTPLPDADSQDACKQICLDTPTCVAVDWNPVDPISKCWWHDVIGVVNTKPGVIHSQVTSRICPDDCLGEYTEFPETKIEGGAPTPATTVDECKKLCTAEPTCFAFDFAPSNPAAVCFILTIDTGRVAGAGVTHYVLDSRDCPDTTVAPTTTTTEAPSTSTSAPTVQPATCLPTYGISANTGAPGGISQPGVTDVQGCTDVCNADLSCLAFDFDPNSPVAACWLHFDPAHAGLLDPTRTGVTHYHITTRECPDTTEAPETTVATEPPATAAPCLPQYTELLGTGAPGGISRPEGTTVEECRVLCTGDLTCYGFDFDPTNPVSFCWLHLDPNYAALIDTDRPSVTHYQILTRDCDTVVTDAPSCDPTYGISANTGAPGGISQPGVSDVQGCTDLCNADLSCLAFDFDPNSPVAACWLHFDPAHAGLLDPTRTGVTHYHITSRECTTTAAPTTTTTEEPTTTTVAPTEPPCPPQWLITPGQQIMGGINQPLVANIDGCILACLSDAGCYGFDFNPTADPGFLCWLHLFPVSTADHTRADVVTNYILERRDCATEEPPTTEPPVCTIFWDMSMDKNIEGGLVQPLANTVDECKLVCLADPTCTGFDIDNLSPIGQKCWIFQFAITPDMRQERTGVDNYILDRCYTATTQAPPTTESPCEPALWEFRDESNAPGGQGQGDISTVDECKALCLSLEGCVGFDYDNNNNAMARCWIHYNPEIVNTFNLGTTGVDQYILLDACPTPAPSTTTAAPTTTTAAPCQITYDVYPNSNIEGGSAQAGIETLQECQALCTATETCLALDFAPLDPIAKCWFHYDPTKVGSPQGRAGVTHYEKVDNCQTSPPTPEPTTVSTTPTPPRYCSADILFLVDSSGSIQDNAPEGQDNWALIKDYVARIINDLEVGPNLFRVSVITFSNSAQIRVGLDSFSSDKASILAEVNNLPYAAGYTNTPLAINLARSSIFTGVDGDRPGNTDIVVLITDGEVTLGSTSAMFADADFLKSQGVQIFAVEVGRFVNQDEVNRIVTDMNHVYSVTDFIQLAGQATELADALEDSANLVCGQPVTGSPSTTPAPSQPTPDPTPTPAPTPSPPDTIDVRSSCLLAHNNMRALHEDTPSLVYDSNLERGAQDWAIRLAEERSFYHGSTGENLYLVTDYNLNTVHQIEEAIFAWYDERNNYVYETGESSNGNAIGHFTQLVWKESTRLGCGIATIERQDGSKDWYMVARYSPPGNFAGEFPAQVARPRANANFPTSWQDLL